MKQNRIFREELPGEKKSIVTLLMTGYLATISCLGYAAFYIYIEMGQVDRIVQTIQTQHQTPEQIELIKSRVSRSTHQLRNEMLGLAVLGSLMTLIGGIYTFNLVVRPLRKIIAFTEKNGGTGLPEFKTNNEIKQLATAVTGLVSRFNDSSRKEDAAPPPQKTNY
ncbi:MAG: hypothetical protein ACE5E9_07830 [Nitrospinaceae bacterium]